VVFHQTIDMNQGSIALMGRFEIGKKSLSISFTIEDGLSFISSGCDVIPGPRILDAK